MEMKNCGFTRKDLRGGAGAGQDIASEHFDEMIGSTELYIYRHPNRKIRGYEALQQYLDSQGCEVVHATDSPNPVGHQYQTIRISNKGNEIPIPLLKRAHNWAHQRNLLHMFYKKRQRS